MKYMIKILGLSILLVAFMGAVDGYSQAIISKKFTYGEYEPNLGKIIKFEQYELGSLEVFPTGTLMQYSMWKILSETGDSYFIQLKCCSGSSDYALTTLISESDLIDLIDSIYEMERAVRVDLNTDADYLESRFNLFDNSSFGYVISDQTLRWFIDFDNANDGSAVQLLRVQETKRALEAALAKIEEHKRSK